MRGLGYLPDPPDPKDHDATPHLRALATPDVVARSPYTQTLDQGGLGSCTANAAGQAVRADQMRQLVEIHGQSLPDVQRVLDFPSRLFAYRLALAMDAGTIEDRGTYIRNIFKVYNEVGFPPERAWSYSDAAGDDAKFRQMPDSEAFRQAFDQKSLAMNGGNALVTYRRITSTGYDRVDDIKRAHGGGKLVVFGTQVSQHFCADMGANGGKPIDPPIGERIAGGHALVSGGHNTEGPDVLNSWGWSYGDAGWCRFSWDYMMWDKTTDLWVVETAPLYMP